MSLAAAVLLGRGDVHGSARTYKHSPLMLLVLKELGYDAEMRGGEVYMPSGQYSGQLTHRSMVVHLNGDDYLVDVSPAA